MCLKEDLPPITEFEDHLRNGVFLAKLARFFKPEMVKKIFDEKQVRPLFFYYYFFYFFSFLLSSCSSSFNFHLSSSLFPFSFINVPAFPKSFI